MPYLILNKDLVNKLKYDETDYSAHHLTNKKQIKVSPNNQLIIIENKIYRKSKKYKFIIHEISLLVHVPWYHIYPRFSKSDKIVGRYGTKVREFLEIFHE